MESSNYPSTYRRAARAGRRLRFIGCLSLALSLITICSCSRAGKDHYPTVPENVPATASLESENLKRAQSLQKVAQEQNKDYVYQIGKNDVITIQVYQHPDLSVTGRVGADGMISFPPLGDIKAAGMTERDLQQQIQNQLREGYINEAQVTVSVKEITAGNMGIIGAVPTPGQYSSFEPMTLADLLLKAGGLAPAAGDTALITRLGENKQADVIKIDLASLLNEGDQRWNVLLRPGDVVNILSAGEVHVTGKGVEKPGTYPLKNRDLLQILDDAGGVKYEGKDTIYVVRYQNSHKRTIYEANYPTLLETKTTDIELRDGDRIIVERDPFRHMIVLIGKGLSNTFRFVIGGNYDLFSSNSNSHNHD